MADAMTESRSDGTGMSVESELETMRPGMIAQLSPIALARFAVAVAEALPGLRREHGSGMPTEVCDMARRMRGETLDMRLCPKNRHIAASHFGEPCDCGADEHNATIDRLLALLKK